MQRVLNYINGEMVEPESGAWLDDIDPSAGCAHAQLPDSDGRDVEHAVAAAARAFKEWSHTPAQDRSRVMLAIADLIDDNRERLALAETIDTGKPITLSRTVDIPRAAANFRFFATAVLHWASESHATDHQALNYTLRRPLGVCGCISPWNLPLYLFTWKIAPALAAGNTVVGKPSELTPMTAFHLGEICREAGLPPGVLNIVHGLGPKVGAALVEHPDVRAISFTGGTATGESIARAAAPMFKKLSLELGGKNPNIIFADADYDHALDEALRAAFTNQGEICLCGSRILVERPLYERLVADLTDRTRALRIGDPLDDDTQQGAVVSQAHCEKVLSAIETARAEGGVVHCGGGPASNLPARCRDGYFIEPTVITGLDADCRTNREEIFGPVVTVMPFDDEHEAIAMADATDYGLAAMIWTGNLTRAHRMAERVNSGIIWINCWMLRDLRTPFGGMKRSGLGREGGEEALRFFTEPKNVCIRL